MSNYVSSQNEQKIPPLCFSFLITVIFSSLFIIIAIILSQTTLKMESNQVQRNRKKRRVYHELDLELPHSSSLAYSALSIVLHHWMIPTQGWQLPSLITEKYDKSKVKMIEFKQTTLKDSGEIDLMAYTELLNTDQVDDDCVDMLANAIKVLREVDTGQELQHFNIQVSCFFFIMLSMLLS